MESVFSEMIINRTRFLLQQLISWHNWSLLDFAIIVSKKISEPKLAEEPPILAGLEPLFQDSLCCL